MILVIPDGSRNTVELFPETITNPASAAVEIACIAIRCANEISQVIQRSSRPITKRYNGVTSYTSAGDLKPGIPVMSHSEAYEIVHNKQNK